MLPIRYVESSSDPVGFSPKTLHVLYIDGERQRLNSYSGSSNREFDRNAHLPALKMLVKFQTRKNNFNYFSVAYSSFRRIVTASSISNAD